MTKLLLATVLISFFSFCNSHHDKKPISPKAKVQFRMASDSLIEGFEEMQLDGKPIYLNPKIEISEKDISFVDKEYNQHGTQDILLELNKDGSIKFARTTKSNIDHKLAIIVNGELLMAPKIMTEITGGKVSITGNFDANEVERIYKGLTDL